jgi:hypothetical protein
MEPTTSFIGRIHDREWRMTTGLKVSCFTSARRPRPEEGHRQQVPTEPLATLVADFCAAAARRARPA